MLKRIAMYLAMFVGVIAKMHIANYYCIIGNKGSKMVGVFGSAQGDEC
jgi:hypothetical protein